MDSKARHEDVFSIIVKRYVETAEPVGSRFVARRLNLSSATIRNVMSDLEDAGFITHPHTSAGRVPTDRGYRYYIDSLMHVKNINADTVRSVKEEYGHAAKSLENILEKTSHLISCITNCVGLTLFSEYDRLYLEGASHMITEPEFKDLKKLYAILKFLEEKRDILSLLHGDLETENLTIRIGRETGFNYLSDCSIVTRGYRVKGRLSGRIGVIGPKRMVYEKVIPAVEFMADTVSEIFERLDV